MPLYHIHTFTITYMYIYHQAATYPASLLYHMLLPTPDNNILLKQELLGSSCTTTACYYLPAAFLEISHSTTYLFSTSIGPYHHTPIFLHLGQTCIKSTALSQFYH